MLLKLIKDYLILVKYHTEVFSGLTSFNRVEDFRLTNSYTEKYGKLY